MAHGYACVCVCVCVSVLVNVCVLRMFLKLVICCNMMNVSACVVF